MLVGLTKEVPLKIQTSFGVVLGFIRNLFKLFSSKSVLSVFLSVLILGSIFFSPTVMAQSSAPAPGGVPILTNCHFANNAKITPAEAKSKLNRCIKDVGGLVYVLIFILLLVRLSFFALSYFNIFSNEDSSKNMVTTIGDILLAVLFIGMPVTLLVAINPATNNITDFIDVSGLSKLTGVTSGSSGSGSGSSGSGSLGGSSSGSGTSGGSTSGSSGSGSGSSGSGTGGSGSSGSGTSSGPSPSGIRDKAEKVAGIINSVKTPNDLTEAQKNEVKQLITDLGVCFQKEEEDQSDQEKDLCRLASPVIAAVNGNQTFNEFVPPVEEPSNEVCPNASSRNCLQFSDEAVIGSYFFSRKDQTSSICYIVDFDFSYPGSGKGGIANLKVCPSNWEKHKSFIQPVYAPGNNTITNFKTVVGARIPKESIRLDPSDEFNIIWQ